MKKFSFFSVLLLLCMLVVPFQTSADDSDDLFIRGDADANGEVNIADVTALIDYLLKGAWPEVDYQTFTANGVQFKMVKVVGGTFTMGATPEQGSDALSNESPTHDVMLSDYYIGETEVTQELWVAVMGSNPSEFTSANGYTDNLQRPVEMVSWSQCQAFLNKLNELTGKNFRLPTEAEWEFAARGGTKSKGYKYAGSNVINDVAWYRVNASDMGSTSLDYGPHSVGTKQANELGIYDMSGNVREWVNDWYGDYGNAQVNPTGPSTGTYRVNRGGCWNYSATYCRVSYRCNNLPTFVRSFVGLRLALPCE